MRLLTGLMIIILDIQQVSLFYNLYIKFLAKEWLKKIVSKTSIISYANNLDITTLTGKLVAQIIGVVAEFKKDIIQERVVARLGHEIDSSCCVKYY